MDEVKISRPGDGDDPSKMTAEQLAFIKHREDRKAGMAVVFFGIGFIMLVVAAIPMIAALYRWGFGA